MSINKHKRDSDDSKGLVIGISLGLTFGFLFDNISIFFLLGISIGLLYDEYRKKKI